jgi:hypothetical protein
LTKEVEGGIFILSKEVLNKELTGTSSRKIGK